jgi:hypothetical protein
MDGCKCKYPISAMLEFLNFSPDVANMSYVLGIILKNNITSVE